MKQKRKPDKMVNVKVAVRVRPFNSREKDRDAKLIIRMEDAVTYIVRRMHTHAHTQNLSSPTSIKSKCNYKDGIMLE